jgi:flavodoxin
MEDRRNKGITRRQLVGGMLAMGVATMGAGLLGGCASPRGADTSQAGSSSGGAATGVPGASTTSSASPAPSEGAGAPAQAAAGTLVVVFSWSGNTLAVANRVAEDLQADLFRIEPAVPYTSDYDEMLRVAQDEQVSKALPRIAAGVPDWDRYSTIYLGFPTWWGHLPQIVRSFLAEHDCSGRVVYPFNTNAGSGFASCLSDISDACPGADVRDGLSLRGDGVSSSTAEIDAWVARNA